MRRFATLTLIFALSIVCVIDSSAGLYPPGTWDHTAMATISTLEATHIVVGEVTHVSFVFWQEDSEPLSIVTVRVDRDIKAEIERLDNENANSVGRVSEEEGDVATPGETEEEDSTPDTVSFIQTGGPYEDGDWVEAVGMPLLKVGDNVLLRLKPSNFTVTHNGQEYNSCTDEYGTVYYVQTDGDNVDEYIIKESWQRLDVNVMDMTRIVRTTLEQPETMRTLERRINGNWNAVTNEANLQSVMKAVAEIEEELSLPSFDRDNYGEQYK